jgi:hypothetical protein
MARLLWPSSLMLKTAVRRICRSMASLLVSLDLRPSGFEPRSDKSLFNPFVNQPQEDGLPVSLLSEG